MDGLKSRMIQSDLHWRAFGKWEGFKTRRKAGFLVSY